MKNKLTTTLLMLGLSTSLTIPPLLAETKTSTEPNASQEKPVQSEGVMAELKTQIVTRYALLQAKASTLKAQIALEIDQSPKTALKALQDTKGFLQQAKNNANEATMEKISQLQAKAKVAQQAVNDKADNAKEQVSGLVVATEASIKAHAKNIQESEEAVLLKTRYVQLKAKIALMQAMLAEKSGATEKQVTAYLDESRDWYSSLKSQTAENLNKQLAEISAQIDETKQAVQSKDKQVRSKLASLLERAAVMIKAEDPTQ